MGVTTDITLKALHQRTGKLLSRVRQGERFRVLRHGETEGFLLPPSEAIDPGWSQIMAEVWAAQKQPRPVRENPVLTERKARNRVARLR
jgi:antitoxin (DNA-binding transcriptional repressor) of toxin-antitoxin stability system